MPPCLKGLILFPALLLCHCVAGGPSWPRRSANPYSPEREAFRISQHERADAVLRATFERGVEDGRLDASQGRPPDPGSRAAAYPDPASRKAYADGYRQGFSPPPNSSPPPSSAAYSQGYDFGLRDRLAGRPSDPDAHTATADPVFKAAFIQGYMDAFEQRHH